MKKWYFLFFIISSLFFELKRCTIPHFKALDQLFWPLDWFLTLGLILLELWTKISVENQWTFSTKLLTDTVFRTFYHFNVIFKSISRYYPIKLLSNLTFGIESKNHMWSSQSTFLCLLNTSSKWTFLDNPVSWNQQYLTLWSKGWVWLH